MIWNNKWYIDEENLDKKLLSVDEGAETIASYCWEIEDWKDIKNQNGETVMQEREIVDGCFEELVVPDTVKVICERAFYRMTTLRKLSILSNVTEIGKEAFKGCEQLSEVVAPQFRVSNAKDPETKLKLTAGFCTHKDLYNADVAEDYLKYLKRNRNKLWNEPVFLNTLLEKKLISLAELDDYLEKAAETASPEIRSMLLDYKNAAPQAAVAKVAEKKEKAAMRSLMRTKPTTAELKAIWGVKKIDTGTIELTKYSGKDTEVEIPDVIGRQTVIRLNGTFFGNRTLKSVVIPKTITEITGGAFSGCSALTEITLPPKLKLVGMASFKGCSLLTELVLPKNVSKLGGGFAAECVALQELKLSDKIRAIPINIIEGCVNLENLYLPEKCKTIHNFAFVDLNALKHLYIPASTVEIGFDAIIDCPNLTIHASAGSCAEQYAKEHNIPFVAE